jgi:hypothetical protein
VSLDENGHAAITASQIDNGSNDICGIASMVVTPDEFDCGDVGENTVVLKVTDLNGNIVEQEATVTVEDNISPSINCPSNIEQSADPGSCSTEVNFEVTAADNCPGVTINYSQESGTLFNVGNNTVTATATDANGHQTECSFMIIISDGELPTINCPSNIFQSANPGSCSKTVNYIATASDNCSVSGISYSPASGSTFNVGTTNVTATATDASGNSKQCNFSVTITDNQKPLVTCPANIVDSTNAGSCTKNISYSAGSSDNCAVQSTSYNPNSGSSFAIGITTVTVTVTDVNGNNNSCSFTVEIKPRTEKCNGVDDDCDGLVDENCSGDKDKDGIPDNVDNCPDIPNSNQADSDCDGVGDVCDQCLGGNDKIDNNHDGKPDCKFPPAYTDIIPAWKCGNNKVYICHLPPGNPNNKQTLCVSYNAITAHMNHGDYLGGCDEAKCNGSLKSNGEQRLIDGEILSNNFSSVLIGNEFEVIPNPNHGNFSIVFNTEMESGTIQLINLLGKSVWVQSFAAHTNMLEINSDEFLTKNSSGLYHIIIRSENRVYSKAVLIID